jgi:hypothetical protein
MSFRIRGLPAEEFKHLFGMTDEELAQQGAVRRTADNRDPGYPCLVSLTDSKLGDELILEGSAEPDLKGPICQRRWAADVSPERPRT